MVVGHLHDELGSQRLPREIFALAPAALATRLALHTLFAALVGLARPVTPRVGLEGALPVGRQVLHELATLHRGEARRDADVVQRPVVIVETQQERAHGRPRAVLVPAEAGDDAVAVALMLHLEHDPLVRLVEARRLLGHDAVQACALEAAEPVGGHAAIGGDRRQVDGRGGTGEG